ncbi:DUF4824 family protein [Pseudomonas wenzhouensis]|uniref:DUF4824 family protein n=1 Tax=Pseudomonas wenzhouensis TaxID=2906062 RepID=UPI001E65BF9D|nr:DUF4824 family protein [Pseudomonas wenzhouensis]UFQ98055.1 DUF4824 family protein [Pseudomonas wenzhouensis]
MNRPLWLGLGLILASNAVALAGVWYNRSGAPQAQLQLSEREIQLPYDSWLRGEENSALRLQLAWRQADADWSWLDEAKLRQLGFAPNDLGRRAERPLWLVLELDGASYRKQVERATSALAAAQAALADRPQDQTLRQQRDQRRLELQYEQQQATRLLLVDAGLDAEALRQAWPDRQRQVILAGRLRPYRHADMPHYSASVVLQGDRISVPRRYREAFAQWRLRAYDEKRPKVQVEVAFGQRHEPWLVRVDQ